MRRSAHDVVGKEEAKLPAAIPKERILDAVLWVWREQGYASATTAEVARRAGVVEVTLFRRFGDKATLFSAALAREADLLRAAAPEYTGDIARDLLGVVAAYDRMLSRNAAIIIDFLRSAPHIEDLKKSAPSPLVAINQLARILEMHQRAGNLTGGDARTELAELLGPVLLKRMLSQAQPGLELSNDLPSLVQRYLHGRTS